MIPLRRAIPALLIGTLSAATPPDAVWSFDAEQAGALEAVGGVVFGEPGPRRPAYPRFSQTNRAVRFDGRGARLVVPDTGAGSIFDFGNGDAITLEAWVRPADVRKGDNVYLIGKGRTDPKAANPNNQNWALRLREVAGTARLSFLFADRRGGWHRWTSDTGIRASDRWHHVAVTYRFGEPASVRGCIDGRIVQGEWDMAGASADEPVVDDAPVWIGSSMGGGAGSSFRGWLDDVRVHRAALPEKELTGRFATTLPPPAAEPAAATDRNAGNDSAGGTPKGPSAGMPVVKAPQPFDWKTLRPGEVLVELCEEWNPERNTWPEVPLKATDSFTAPAFGFLRVPQRYVDTGVRGARPDPYLLG